MPIKYWFPVYLWAGLIFAISSIPGSSLPSLFVFQNIIYHLLVFLVFALLLERALKYSYQNLKPAKLFLLTIVISLLYALSDEFHQLFVPFRTPSLLDVSVDGLGVLIGSVIGKKQGMFKPIK